MDIWHCGFWSLSHLSDNWCAHQKIGYHNYSFRILNYSVLMVFQNSWNILGSSLHIWFPTPQKLYVLHWTIVILQLNSIGVPLILLWIICLERFQNNYWWCLIPGVYDHIFILQVPSYHNSQLQLVKTSIRFYPCLINIHAWVHWRSFPWLLH